MGKIVKQITGVFVVMVAFPLVLLITLITAWTERGGYD